MNLRKLKIIENNLENIFCSFILFLFFLISSNSFAADSLSYSGRLVKADGSPVAGPVDLKIDLAYTNTPGTILCSQNFSSVALSNGVFHLKLDLVCPGPPVKTVTEILSAVPANFAAALRVSDVSNNKIYAFQEIHSMPFATVSESAKQLAQLGAVNGEVLKWNDTTKKWEPSAAGGGGTVTSVTASAPLAVTSGATTPALSITQATTSSDGFLSATDWNIFNNKVGVATGGTTLQFYRGDNSWQTLNTDVVPDAGMTNLYFTNARSLGVPLAGLNTALVGAIQDGDKIIEAFGKTQAQINSINTDSAKYLIKNATDALTGEVTVNVTTGSLLLPRTPSDAELTAAANVNYVKTYADTKLPLTGGTLTNDLTLNTQARFKGGSNYVELKANAALAASISLTLPMTVGGSGDVLTSNGAGVLSWVNPASLTAGAGTVNSSSIIDGTIVDADINASANIAQTKISGLTTSLSGKEPTITAGTTSQYFSGDKSWQTLNGAAVANTPAGSIAATTTQAALNELDTEKEAAVTAGLATDYYKGNKTWSNLGTDVIASALSGFTTFATKTDIVAGDSVFTAFRKTQKQLDDIDGDYVSKSGNNTVTGTFNISGITAFLNIPTPTGTTLSEAANVDYVKTYVGSMGQWTKGTGGNAADIYFNTGNVGIGTVAPYGKLHSSTSDTATSIEVTANPSLVLQNLNATSGVFNTLMFSNSGGFGSAAISVPQTQNTNKGDNLILQTKTSTGGWNLNQLVLTPAGNVGIGTATPAEKLSVVGDISVTGQVTSKDFFEKTVTIADGWAIGDYVEIVQGSPSGSGASSYWEIHIGGTRGNWTEGSTYLVAGTHSTDALWREAANSSDNTYVGNSKCFTVDVKGNGNSPQFRIRALKASASCGTPASLPLNFRIRSIGLNNGWTSLSATGAGATVVGMQSMGLNWSLFTGNPQANAKVAIHANSAGDVGIGTLTPASKLSVAGTIESTTGGVKYPDGSTQATSSFGPVFSAYASTSPSTVNSVWVKVPYNSVEFDPDSSLDTANQRIKPTKAGYYRISMAALLTQIGTGGTTNYLSLYKNGAVIKNTSLLVNYTASYTQTLQVESTVYLNGTTDYLEGWWTSNSTNSSTVVAGVANTFISGNYIRP